MIKLLVWRQQVHDDKRGVDFPKDKGSYKGHTIDIIYRKDTKKVLDEQMADKGFKFPLELTLEPDVDYFAKKVSFTRNDGTKGTKIKIVILSYKEMAQGKFESKSLDELVDEVYSSEEDTDY